jgi:hypothetical protein
MPVADSSAAHAGADPPAVGRASGWKTLVVVLGALVFAAVILIAFLELVVARRIPELTRERLALAEELWQESGPDNYDMDLNKSGLRSGTVHIEVRNGEPTSAIVDGHRPPQQRTWTAWTVPGQFAMLADELDRAEASERGTAQPPPRALLRCEFDSEFGFPRQFQRVAYGGQPGTSWQVIQFTPR